MSAHQKQHPFDFKTQYGLGFSTQDDEIVVDFFCGGGGAGTGLEMGLGRTVNVAKNHSPERPAFHEIRALGAWLYEQQNFPPGVHPGAYGARRREDDEAPSRGARRKEDRVPGAVRRIGVLR